MAMGTSPVILSAATPVTYVRLQNNSVYATAGANGEWRMANGEWRMANGEWRMAGKHRNTAAVQPHSIQISLCDTMPLWRVYMNDNVLYRRRTRACKPRCVPPCYWNVVVAEADAAAIRDVFQGGELSAAIELRRRLPGITDNAKARHAPELSRVGRRCQSSPAR
jgi:hypothetical protein